MFVCYTFVQCLCMYEPYGISAALKQTRETKKRKAEALNVHEEIKNKIEEETETAIKDKDDCMEEHVEQQMEGKDS